MRKAKAKEKTNNEEMPSEEEMQGLFEEAKRRQRKRDKEKEIVEEVLRRYERKNRGEYD